jgi:hypothetical protein
MDSPLDSPEQSLTSHKSADEVRLSQKTLRNQPGVADGEPELFSLSEKIDQYLIKLGYSNAHVLGIVVNLLTVGKVRVEFRHYVERLELVDPADKTTRGVAVDIFDKYLIEKKGRSNQEQMLEFTGKIIVQSPEARRP